MWTTTISNLYVYSFSTLICVYNLFSIYSILLTSVWSLSIYELCYIGLIFAFICILLYQFDPYLHMRLRYISSISAYIWGYAPSIWFLLMYVYNHTTWPLPIYMVVPFMSATAYIYDGALHIYSLSIHGCPSIISHCLPVLYHFIYVLFASFQLISYAYMPTYTVTWVLFCSHMHRHICSVSKDYLFFFHELLS